MLLSPPSNRSIRQSLGKYSWFILAGLFVSITWLGWLGFDIADDSNMQVKRRSIWDNLYLSIQLFVLNSGAIQSPNICIEFARFLAPVWISWAAIKAIWVFFGDKLPLFKLQFFKNHVVICGLSEEGVHLVEHHLKNKQDVVVITIDNKNDFLANYRQSGVVSLVADATKSEILEMARVQYADIVYAVTDIDSINIEIAKRLYHDFCSGEKSGKATGSPPVDQRCKDSKKTRKKRRGMLSCYVHLNDLSLKHSIARTEEFLNTYSHFSGYLFNMCEESARHLIKKHVSEINDSGRSPRGHFVILGFNQAGECITKALNGMGKAVTIIDENAMLKESLFQLDRDDSYYAKELVTFIQGNPDTIHLGASLNSLGIGEVDIIDAIFICYDDEKSGLSMGKALLRSVDQNVFPKLIVCCNRNASHYEASLPDKMGLFNMVDRTHSMYVQSSPLYSIILDECKNLNDEEIANSKVVGILRYALGHPEDGVREEAIKIMIRLIECNESLVKIVLESVSEDIINSINVVDVIGSLYRQFANRPDVFKSRLLSFGPLLIYILGEHYDKEVEKSVSSIIQNMLVSIGKKYLFRISKMLIAPTIARVMDDAYWRKGPYACGYLEMRMSLTNREMRAGVVSIGKLFTEEIKELPSVDELLQWSRLENGLIAWYLYSILPIFAIKASDDEKETKVFKDTVKLLHESKNKTARYIVQKTLWILVTLSDIAGKKKEDYENLFCKYCEECLIEDGWQLTLEHKCNYDRTIRKYIGNEDVETQEYWQLISKLKPKSQCANSNEKKYWADYNVMKNTLSLKYNNNVFHDYCTFSFSQKEGEEKIISFLINFMNKLSDNQYKTDALLYFVATLGKIGELNALMAKKALKIIKYIIENNYISYNQESLFKGRSISYSEVLESSMLRIKYSYPAQVEDLFNQLGVEDLEQFKGVMKIDDKTIPMVIDAPVVGDKVYQRAFLYNAKIRAQFGRGIIMASRAWSVYLMFLTFSRNFTQYFYEGKNDRALRSK